MINIEHHKITTSENTKLTGIRLSLTNLEFLKENNINKSSLINALLTDYINTLTPVNKTLIGDNKTTTPVNKPTTNIINSLREAKKTLTNDNGKLTPPPIRDED